MSPTRFSVGTLVVGIALCAGAFTVTHAAIDTLAVHTHAYFSDLHKAVARSAESPKASAQNSSLTDQFFVGLLKQHSALIGLVRTNTKGLVLSEVVRGKSPKRVRRSDAAQIWCSSVMKTHAGYRSSDASGDSAHPALLWSEPINKSGRFVGVLCARIDMVAGIGEALAGEPEPFVVMRNGRPLYTNLWKDTAYFVEVALTLPGDTSLVIRCATAPPSPSVDSAAMRATQDSLVRSAQIAYEESAVKKPDSSRSAGFGALSDWRVLGAMVVVLVVMLGLLYVAVYHRETRVLRAGEGSA